MKYKTRDGSALLLVMLSMSCITIILLLVLHRVSLLHGIALARKEYYEQVALGNDGLNKGFEELRAYYDQLFSTTDKQEMVLSCVKNDNYVVHVKAQTNNDVSRGNYCILSSCLMKNDDDQARLTISCCVTKNNEDKNYIIDAYTLGTPF